MTRRVNWRELVVVVAVGVASAVWSRSASALPAFARAYGVECETCHYPMPPRLNSIGMAFKRFGYRMPDADDNGNLILKPKPSKSFGDDFSLHGDILVQNTGNPDPGTGQTQFQLGAVELHGAGALPKGFSYRVMYALRSDGGGPSNMEEADAQYTAGTPTHLWTIRGGQFFPNTWEKMNMQELTTSMPYFDDNKTGAVGSFAGFNPSEPQQGVSIGYNINHLTDGQFSSTMLTAAVMNGVDETGSGSGADTNNSKDILVEATHLWGNANTLSGFYYKGKTLINTDNINNPPVAPYGPFNDDITRIGVAGNYVIKPNPDKDLSFDVLGGYMHGKDETTEPGVANLTSKIVFGELAVTPRERLTGVIRLERFSPDGGAVSNGVTVGLIRQPADNFFIIAEYNHDTMMGRTASLRFRFAY